jgi:hypothetical protein
MFLRFFGIGLLALACASPSQAGNGCPPGLAKKSPACVPPGLAKKGAVPVRVGDIIIGYDLHRVTRPDWYGLPVPRDGTGYYIYGDRILRVDESTFEVLDLLRAVDAILD